MASGRLPAAPSIATALTSAGVAKHRTTFPSHCRSHHGNQSALSDHNRKSGKPPATTADETPQNQPSELLHRGVSLVVSPCSASSGLSLSERRGRSAEQPEPTWNPHSRTTDTCKMETRSGMESSNHDPEHPRICSALICPYATLKRSFPRHGSLEWHRQEIRCSKFRVLNRRRNLELPSE